MPHIGLLELNAQGTAIDSVKIDFNGDHGRQDVQAYGYFDWRVGTATTIERDFGGIKISISARHAQTKLVHDWWKAGFDYGARLVSDGIVLENPLPNDAIIVKVRGLKPGKHRIVSWHNAVSAVSSGAFRVRINGVEKQSDIKPSHRVTHDDDAQTWSGEITVDSAEPIEFCFEPQFQAAKRGQVANVILNGFAIDTPDPLIAARKPNPADRDEHVIENPLLKWTSPVDAARFEVYVGTDREA